MENIRNCPVCDLDFKMTLIQLSFSNLSNKNLLNSYKVVACQKCGFCFADGIPDQKAFDIYYKDMSKYESSNAKINESIYDKTKFRFIVKYIEDNIKDKQSKIVEVGCATGLLLYYLKESYFVNLLGVDPSPSCVETIQKRYLIPAISGTISNLSNLLADQYDVVVLIGVLEHIRDLDSAVSEIRKVLKPGGEVCIVVPDGSQYYKGEDAPFQEFSIEHINFFGPKSLNNLMLKFGFKRKNIEQKILEINKNTYTPIILSLFVKQESDSTAYAFDEETMINLCKYIDISQDKINKLDDKIRNIINNNESIVIWGTGTQTLRLLETTNLSQANIKAFVDSNPKYQGSKLNNVPVIAPTELQDNFISETILISTRAFQEEIENQIITYYKLKNKIIKLF